MCYSRREREMEKERERCNKLNKGKMQKAWRNGAKVQKDMYTWEQRAKLCLRIAHTCISSYWFLRTFAISMRIMNKREKKRESMQRNASQRRRKKKRQRQWEKVQRECQNNNWLLASYFVWTLFKHCTHSWLLYKRSIRLYEFCRWIVNKSHQTV